jgi:hypothetical protein
MTLRDIEECEVTELEYISDWVKKKITSKPENNILQ